MKLTISYDKFRKLVEMEAYANWQLWRNDRALRDWKDAEKLLTDQARSFGQRVLTVDIHEVALMLHEQRKADYARSDWLSAERLLNEKFVVVH